MIRKLIFYIFLTGICSDYCYAQNKTAIFLSPRFVSIKGKEGITIFKNATTDTLKLAGTFLNWLPYIENNFSLKIAPGNTDTLKFQFNYPDFIFINNGLTVLNGPGGRVMCELKSANAKTDTQFTGDYSLENAYYLAYNNYLGNHDNESSPYYNAGDKLDDFNKFPRIADSITQIRINYLNNYRQPLDAWFKRHEYWRLTYNGIFRKYNVLFSKEFYGGKKITVNNTYYDFEKDLKLTNGEMVLNTDYLWATNAYLYVRSKKIKRPAADSVLYTIDSVAKGTDVGDILKMRYLPMLYMQSKLKYDEVFAATYFKNAANKLITDSLIQTKLGLPKIGKRVPKVELKDMNGKTISLTDYAGRQIIINFWAVWCGPCIAEFPAENRLFEQYQNKEIAIINICVDSAEEQWRAVSKRNNLQMVNLFCDAATYQSLKSKFNIGPLPRSILVDKNLNVTDNYFEKASLITPQTIETILRK
jgi:peroxiredoxin